MRVYVHSFPLAPPRLSNTCSRLLLLLLLPPVVQGRAGFRPPRARPFRQNLRAVRRAGALALRRRQDSRLVGHPSAPRRCRPWTCYNLVWCILSVDAAPARILLKWCPTAIYA